MLRSDRQECLSHQWFAWLPRKPLFPTPVMLELIFDFLLPMLFELVSHARGWMIAAAVGLGAAPGIVSDSTGWAWTGAVVSGLASLFVAAVDAPALLPLIGGALGLITGVFVDNSVWMWVGGLVGFWTAGLVALTTAGGK